jgi:hypothetical protein
MQQYCNQMYIIAIAITGSRGYRPLVAWCTEWKKITYTDFFRVSKGSYIIESCTTSSMCCLSIKFENMSGCDNACSPGC